MNKVLFKFKKISVIGPWFCIKKKKRKNLQHTYRNVRINGIHYMEPTTILYGSIRVKTQIDCM